MKDLLSYIKEHKEELNLADISRKAGLDSSYLRKAISGSLKMSDEAQESVRPIIERIVHDYKK